MASKPKTHFVADLVLAQGTDSALVAGTDIVLHNLIGGSGVNGVLATSNIPDVDCKLCLKALHDENGLLLLPEEKAKIEEPAEKETVSIHEIMDQVAENIAAEAAPAKPARGSDGLPSRKEILAELAEIGYDGPTSYLKPKLYDILVAERG